MKAEMRNTTEGIGREGKTNATDEEGRCTSGISEMDAIAGGDGP